MNFTNLQTKLAKALTYGLVFAFVALTMPPAVQAQNQAPVSGVSGQFILPNINMQEEFCGNAPGTSGRIGNIGWDSTVVVGGTNPVASVVSVANHPCIITMTTSTTATNGVSITLGPGFGNLFPGNQANWQAEWIISPNQVTTGSYRVGFGTVDTATAIPTNGIYFRFLNGTDTYVTACMDTASVETCSATTITPSAADWLHVTLNSSVAGTVFFTLKDVTTGASSTVSLSSAPAVVLSPMVNIVETGGSVADVLTVDYFGYEQQGLIR
jgi:hypothetical protein